MLKYTESPVTDVLADIVTNPTTRDAYWYACRHFSIKEQTEYVIRHPKFPANLVESTRTIWGAGATSDMSKHMATLCKHIGNREAKFFLVISSDITQMHAVTLWEPEQALTSIYLPTDLIERCMHTKGGLADDLPESAYDFAPETLV